mmetsp:Transcript_16518/g.51686  ORF Transcript_16518/g.51686 Transcript_16518/m.51686 type:complete len:564 (-) Transcript_16518:34-1725(-)
MGINNARSQNTCCVKFDNADRLLQAGKQFHGSVHLKVVSAIQVRGVYLEFYGYEQACSKNGVKVPSKHNSARRTIIKEDVLVYGDPDRPDVIPPGEHSWQVRWTVPEDLPSSFSLSQNAKDAQRFTGVFYTAAVYCNTISRLSCSPIPVKLEGLIRHGMLERSTSLERSARRRFVTGGRLQLSAALERSVSVAGDKVWVDVFFENQSSKPVHGIKVTVKQQVQLARVGKKPLCVSRRVFYTIFDKCKVTPSPGAYSTKLSFQLPSRLPATQNTPHGVVKIEYHVNVRLDIRWLPDMRVRLPLLLLEQSRLGSSPSATREREARERSVGTFLLTLPSHMTVDPPAAPERHDLGKGSAAPDVEEDELVQQPASLEDSDPLVDASSSEAPAEVDLSYESAALASSYSTFEQAKTAFSRFDTNGDGRLDRNEFSALYASLSSVVPNLPTEEAAVFADMDTNEQQGTIEFNEFTDWLVREGVLQHMPSPRSTKRSEAFALESVPFVPPPRTSPNEYGSITALPLPPSPAAGDAGLERSSPFPSPRGSSVRRALPRTPSPTPSPTPGAI